jgi:hypothetical protein
LGNLPETSQESTVAQEFAVRLALIAFITASVQSVMRGAAFEPGLKSALAAGAVCYGLGWICGDLARRIVAESVHAEFHRDEAPAAVPTPQTPTR